MEVRTMFSYEDYKEIIRIVQSTGNQAGYEEALKADKFVITIFVKDFSVCKIFFISLYNRCFIIALSKLYIF